MLTLLLFNFILSHGLVSCLIINNQVSTAVFAVMLIFLSKYDYEFKWLLP